MTAAGVRAMALGVLGLLLVGAGIALLAAFGDREEVPPVTLLTFLAAGGALLASAVRPTARRFRLGLLLIGAGATCLSLGVAASQQWTPEPTPCNHVDGDQQASCAGPWDPFYTLGMAGAWSVLGGAVVLAVQALAWAFRRRRRRHPSPT